MQLNLNQYIPGLLLWLSNKVASSASSLYHEKFGVGVTEWRLLAYFKIYPWSTASKACELMGLDKGAVSRALGTLVAQGYLESRPQGRRKIEYIVTRKGNKLHDAIYKCAMAREEALLEGMTAEERQTLVRLFRHMLNNLEKVQRVGRD